MATRVTEVAPRRIHLAACRAYYFEFGATGVTKRRSYWIRVLTLWTVHGVTPPCRRGFLHPRLKRWSIAMACVKTILHVTTAPPRVQVPSGSLVLGPILPEDSMRHHAWQKKRGHRHYLTTTCTARCLFHTSTASSPGLSLGTPRSSVASGAGLEPGAPRRRVLVQDIRNGHLDYDRMWCGALRPEIAAQPVHGMGIEVRARGMRQVRVHVQRFRRGDALEHR